MKRTSVKRKLPPRRSKWWPTDSEIGAFGMGFALAGFLALAGLFK